MKGLDIIILAAGKGTRMKSDIPKVMHKICGLPMLEIVIENANKLKPDNIFVVVGYKKEIIESYFNKKFEGKLKFIEQKMQNGTGDAVNSCKEFFNNRNSNVLILCGDMPLVSGESLINFIDFFNENNISLLVMSTFVENPYGYGRIIRDGKNFIKIVEEKDASIEEKKINEINTGIYCVKSDILFNLLEKVDNNNAQGEYYLTDIVETAVKNKIDVSAVAFGTSEEFIGINSREQLAYAENILVKRKIAELQSEGVTFIKPETTYLHLNIKIGRDSVIYPDNVIIDNSIIGEKCEIGPFNVIKNTFIADNVNIKAHCYLDSAKIDTGTQIGPFSHLRPGSEIGENCKVGNFVEIKKSILKKEVKASHLSYLGDANIEEGVNVGAGTITCNYDGVNKYKTFIGKHVFIGSDTQLVAPVNIGDYTLIAAGTTVTKDTPANSLVHSRVKQSNIANKGVKYKIETG